ncbi:MAG: prepilin-type N-terminal cleavage/methylation domain-containing protein [Verrucomicrobiota bacterium]
MLKRSAYARGFTLVELLTAVSIIMLLMTLSLGVQRYASEKTSRSKAEVEVRALVVACENYKTDQAAYPCSGASDELSSTSITRIEDAFTFIPANLDLYKQISGDSDLNGIPDGAQGKLPDGKTQADPVYIEFKPSQLRKMEKSGEVQYIRDPWDTAGVPTPYGYSTKRSKNPDDASAGYNSTYDIWSIAKKPETKAAWITNW